MLSTENCSFLEHITTPLHACSLEVLTSPVETQENKLVWPLMLGCYQLDESTGIRRGQLDFYSVPVPEIGNLQSLGRPATILGGDDCAGILDGKWCPRTSPESTLLYATAHADGTVRVIRLKCSAKKSSNPFFVDGNVTSDAVDALCLSLAWNLDWEATNRRKIIASFSNGCVATYSLQIKEDNSMSLQQTEFWQAHKMFNNPAEVWAASFTSRSDIVLTGGDEGQLKVWDLRAGTAKPMQCIQDTFEAGVTVISSHPRKENLVAVGSYDETIAIFDLRCVSASQPPNRLCHTDCLGGGVWRIKWHPFDDERLLLGIMHGGCKIVEMDGLSTDHEQENLGWKVELSFKHHKSMAYGADWLVHKSNQQVFENAASCSFYDKSLYLWHVKG